ncbi:MAG TPA: hypothetical protein VJ201_02650, partial [Candidatus Babeliales bacterium]|nr:hypothetical protein [Candidatus Babeliales bacterium]
VIDPIMGGLNTVCENVTFFVDTTPPQITFAGNSLASGNYTSITTVFVNFTVVEQNFNRIDILTFYDNGSLYRNDSFFNQTFFNILVSSGAYHVNATACDIAGQCVSTNETKIYTIFDGDPHRFDFLPMTTQQILTLSFLVGLTLIMFILSTTFSGIFFIGTYMFAFFSGLFMASNMNLYVGWMWIVIMFTAATVAILNKK